MNDHFGAILPGCLHADDRAILGDQLFGRRFKHQVHACGLEEIVIEYVKLVRALARVVRRYASLLHTGIIRLCPIRLNAVSHTAAVFQHIIDQRSIRAPLAEIHQLAERAVHGVAVHTRVNLLLGLDRRKARRAHGGAADLARLFQHDCVHARFHRLNRGHRSGCAGADDRQIHGVFLGRVHLFGGLAETDEVRARLLKRLLHARENRLAGQRRARHRVHRDGLLLNDGRRNALDARIGEARRIRAIPHFHLEDAGFVHGHGNLRRLDDRRGAETLALDTALFPLAIGLADIRAGGHVLLHVRLLRGQGHVAFRQRGFRRFQNRRARHGCAGDAIRLHRVAHQHRARHQLYRAGAYTVGLGRAFRRHINQLAILNGERYGHVAAKPLGGRGIYAVARRKARAQRQRERRSCRQACLSLVHLSSSLMCFRSSRCAQHASPDYLNFNISNS